MRRVRPTPLSLLLQTLALAIALAGCNLDLERAKRDLESKRPQERVVGLERLAETRDSDVAVLIEPLLRDSSARVRRAALAALAAVGTRGRLNKVVARLDDADLEVRLTAVRVLGDAGRPGRPALLEALRDPSMVVRRAAAEALVGQGIDRRQQTREVARLELQEQIARLRRADDQLRATAARAVGLSGRAAGVEPLIGLLRGDRSPLVIREAALALGRIGGRKAAAALERLSRSKLTQDRAAAAAGLGEISGGLGALMRLSGDREAEVRRVAFEALQRQAARVSSGAAGKLCAAISDPDPAVALAAATLTRRLPPKVCDAAVQALITPLERGGAVRVKILAQLQSEAAGAALLRLARLRYAAFRNDAVKWLTARQWRALEEQGGGDTSSGADQGTGAGTGTGTGTGKTVPAGQAKIDRLLARYPTRVRGSHIVDPLLPPATSQADVIALLQALAGRPAALVWLAEVASEAPAPLRVAALDVLGALPSAGPASAPAAPASAPAAPAPQPNEPVRAALRMALRSEVSSVRQAALRHCGRVGAEEALKYALPLLRHNEFDLRAAAATCLGQLGSAQAVGPLLRLLSKERSVAAIQALAQIGHRRATRPIAKLLLEDHPAGRQGERVAVVQALGQLGDPAAAAAVVRELGHPDWRVRRAAARAMRRWPGRAGIEASLQVCQEDYHAAVRRACRLKPPVR